MDSDKYAGLPGIAYDEPEVYETSDVPNSEDEEQSSLDESSECIDCPHISTAQGYAMFKNCSVGSCCVDFSDCLASSKRKGYVSVSKGMHEWELAATGEPETTIQKYHRLKCEVSELLDEWANLKELTEAGDHNINRKLYEEIQSLQQCLEGLKLEDILKRNIGPISKYPFQKILDDINNLSHNEEVDSSSKNKVITCSIAMSKLNQNSYSDLVGRLGKLETAFLSKPEKDSSIASEWCDRSIRERLQELSAKVALLDEGRLKLIESRLTDVLVKMDAIHDKAKGALNVLPEKDQINELYNLQKKHRDIQHILPDIIDRLVVLEPLHKQAVEFVTCLDRLQKAQENLKSTLQNNEIWIKKLQDNFEVQLKTINENVNILEQRISNLTDL